MKLFVYGTLLQGLERAQVLRESAYLGPAMITGDLFDLGEYPGVRPGTGSVVGELYEIAENTLEQIDRIEGYDERSPAASLFVREEIRTQTFARGDYIPAFYYRYNRKDAGTLIPHGDYRRYRLEQGQETLWIVAYGSNLSRARLRERVGEVQASEPGMLEGFRLVFNKKPDKEPGVYANILYAGVSARCPAVSYLVTKDQVAILDSKEGVPDHYLRMALPFRTNSGATHLRQAYIAHPAKLVWGCTPQPEYFRYLEIGYQEHGLPLEVLRAALSSSCQR